MERKRSAIDGGPSQHADSAAAGEDGMSEAASRMRRYRERQRRGLAIVPVETDLLGLVDLLTATGHLQITDSEDFEAVRAALGKYISEHVNERYA
jgi:hypothetical protein